MLLSELMDERGLSSADVASLLEEHGVTITLGPRAGEPIDVRTVNQRRQKNIPGPWKAALGVEDAPKDDPPQGQEGASSGRGRREKAPKRPSEAAIAILSPGAAKRIAGAYRFAGAALAAGSGSKGVAYVWDDQADNIAELWLRAAEENPWAARFVTMMQAGGTMGDLGAAHLYLAGATLYVLGASIPAGDAIFAKYGRHRPVQRPAAERNGAAEGPQPETADDAAAGPVVDG